MYDTESMGARYWALVDQRDAVDAKCEPLHVEIDKANAQVQAAQAGAAELAGQIDALRGGSKWLALKREIAVLARALVRIPPRA